MAIVRMVTEHDLPRILELYRQLVINLSPTEPPNPSPEDCRWAFAEMCTIPGYKPLVAEKEGEVVGTAMLVILPGLSHGVSPFAVVDEKYRRQGIGKLLMDYAVARARDADCYKIMLISDKRREQAHKFYRSLGFETSAYGFRLYL